MSDHENENQQQFQAIGVIRGDVSIDDESKVFIQMDNNSYSLLFTPHRKQAYKALMLDVKITVARISD